MLVPQLPAKVIPPVIPFTFAAFHNAKAVTTPQGAALQLDLGDNTRRQDAPTAPRAGMGEVTFMAISDTPSPTVRFIVVYMHEPALWRT